MTKHSDFFTTPKSIDTSETVASFLKKIWHNFSNKLQENLEFLPNFTTNLNPKFDRKNFLTKLWFYKK